MLEHERSRDDVSHVPTTQADSSRQHRGRVADLDGDLLAADRATRRSGQASQRSAPKTRSRRVWAAVLEHGRPAH